jgi:hypothetical protein
VTTTPLRDGRIAEFALKWTPIRPRSEGKRSQYRDFVPPWIGRCRGGALRPMSEPHARRDGNTPEAPLDTAAGGHSEGPRAVQSGSRRNAGPNSTKGLLRRIRPRYWPSTGNSQVERWSASWRTVRRSARTTCTELRKGREIACTSTEKCLGISSATEGPAARLLGPEDEVKLALPSRAT